MAYIVDDDVYPYSSVCFIQARWGDVWYAGSGVLVGRNDVLTASHVIYDSALGGVADEIIVMPSYDAGFSYGVGISDDGVYHYAEVEYYSDFDLDGDGFIAPGDGSWGLGGTELDVALITLNEAAGDIYGWMGIDTGFTGGSVNISGHPGALGNFSSNTQGWVYPDPVDWNFLISSFNVSYGNSGGPVWYDYGSGPYAVGVVSTGGYAADLGAHAWLLDAIFANDHFIVEGGPAVEDYVGSSGVIDFHYVSGASFQYSLEGNLDQATLIHLNGGVDGIDRLTSIDRIVFTDGVLALDLDGNAGDAYRLYQAAFDREPDLEGLGFWIDQLDVGRGDLSWMARSFIASPEFQLLYGSPDTVSNSEFIDLVYDNVLNRNPDPGGYGYWMGRMDNGYSHEDILVSFSESPENQANVIGQIEHGIWYV